jgi:hypothetical protein
MSLRKECLTGTLKNFGRTSTIVGSPYREFFLTHPREYPSLSLFLTMFCHDFAQGNTSLKSQGYTGELDWFTEVPTQVG